MGSSPLASSIRARDSDRGTSGSPDTVRRSPRSVASRQAFRSIGLATSVRNTKVLDRGDTDNRVRSSAIPSGGGHGSPRAHFHPRGLRESASRRGEVPKRPNGADCKSAGSRLRRFESSPLHQRRTRAESAASSHRARFKRSNSTGVSRAGIAQLARARAFQARGRGFESRFPLQLFPFRDFQRSSSLRRSAPKASHRRRPT